MKEQTNFVVITNEGYWGSGPDWVSAAQKAHALNKSKNGIKKGVKAYGCRVTATKPLDEEQVKDIQSRFGGTEDLKSGDLCPVLVTDYGSVTVYNGKLQEYPDLKEFPA